MLKDNPNLPPFDPPAEEENRQARRRRKAVGRKDPTAAPKPKPCVMFVIYYESEDASGFDRIFYMDAKDVLPVTRGVIGAIEEKLLEQHSDWTLVRIIDWKELPGLIMHSVLAARSNFSIGELILTVEKLIAGAKDVGATAIAMIDTMSITGMIDFTNRSKKAGIKPIIGCRLRLVDDPAWRKTKEAKKAPPEYYLTCYVLSERGLKALFRLLTLANSDERFYFAPKLGWDDLFAELATLSGDDLAVATGDVYSVLHHPEHVTLLNRIVASLGAANVFMTLSPINTPYWDTLNKRAIAATADVHVSFLVTRPVLYPKDGADAAEIMGAVTSNTPISSLWHKSPVTTDLCPISMPDLVRQSIAAAERLEKRGVTGAKCAFREGLNHTDTLVEMAKYEWSKAPVSLPVMATDEFRTMLEECKKGWSTRFAQPVFGHRPTPQELTEVYRPRLSYELDVLKKLGFAGYFLLVQDVVNYAKSSGILVGPGRGSVGGSLVAYLMGITDCDPIRFGLLFERFINPDRIDLPDADLDFMSSRRHEVIEYLIAKFGQSRVAGISNFGSLQAASAIRGVSKAFGRSEEEYRCSKLTPKAHGAHIELSKAAELVPEIGMFRDRFKEIWAVCLQLEGVMNVMGRHAAGVVVGGCDLVERAVIERRKDGATINWDKRIVEDQGLVKMDILGLSTLDLIKEAMDYIRERHSSRVNIMQVPLDDPKVLENFANALTTGIFQFESGGMRRLLKELGKDGAITFDDITAATALYRPGPMESGMMDSFWKRKQGLETVEYDHPLMEPILKPTFGVMVYQEQVMQVSRTIAGYSAPDADKLRKIMGKKLPEEMKKERGKFVDGCVKTIGCTEEWAGDLFDKIEGFAGYGFNKSHSVEYSLISWQSMWLKTHYPVEFFAAALSLMDDEKLPALLKDATRFGIEVVLPDVNLSTERFEILTDTKLCIPFTRVKGMSEKAALEIVEKRKAGRFASQADFEARCRSRMVHKGKMDALDRIGAFASVEPASPPQRHPDRVKHQIELLPGLITANVPVPRTMVIDNFVKAKIALNMKEYRDKFGPEGEGDGWPVKPWIGRNARFMVITDCPTNGEEAEGKMSWGMAFGYTAEALSENGLARDDAYWTALIKRPKEGRQVSGKEIEKYLPYLTREIEILKPPAIVLLGSTTVRQFMPAFKGKASEAAGKIVYSSELDANLVIGFNPGEIYHSPEKQADLNRVFEQVVELLS